MRGEDEKQVLIYEWTLWLHTALYNRTREGNQDFVIIMKGIKGTTVLERGRLGSGAPSGVTPGVQNSPTDGVTGKH